MIRPPAVAGRFYPSDAQELAHQIGQYVSGATKKVRALGCVVPHAGYMYSGGVAGAVYSSLEIPTRCILLGPRHYPQGQPMAILTEGSFATPLGEARIDEALAAELARACPLLREDAVAHEREHSLEVQLPFLQRIARRFPLRARGAGDGPLRGHGGTGPSGCTGGEGAKRAGARDRELGYESL